MSKSLKISPLFSDFKSGLLELETCDDAGSARRANQSKSAKRAAGAVLEVAPLPAEPIDDSLWESWPSER